MRFSGVELLLQLQLQDCSVDDVDVSPLWDMEYRVNYFACRRCLFSFTAPERAFVFYIIKINANAVYILLRTLKSSTFNSSSSSGVP